MQLIKITEGSISLTLVYVDATQGWIQYNGFNSNVRDTTFITATGGTIN